MKNKREKLLPEYAGNEPAVIEPSKTKTKGIHIPVRAVLCFFGDVLKEIENQTDVQIVHHLKSEMGRHPIYTFGEGNNQVALFHPGIGSPMAAAGMEEIIALGAQYIVACGGAGVLNRDLQPGSVIIPTAAIRDEGTSYHYQPRRRLSRPHRDAVQAIKKACRNHDTPFVTGLTWTTDAFYRETPRKIRSRIKEGCLAVEMEAAAFFAVARFRSVKFAQILYAGDDVSGKEWDRRRWDNRPTARQKLLMLAIDAVRLMK
jgi:uridine phosphorylase